MAALTTDRDTQHRKGDLWDYPVAAGKRIFIGALVALKDGLAQPAATATGLVAVGRAEARADNASGADGAIRIHVRRGVFNFMSAVGTDAITSAHVGRTVFIVDDQTVALTDAGGARSAAGRVMDVDGRGVWVEV
jgi:hypothetical protein